MVPILRYYNLQTDKEYRVTLTIWTSADSNIPGSDAAPDGFRYMIRTFACGYESASSDFVTAIPTGGCPTYSAPSNLTATNSGCKSVNLSWSGSLPAGTLYNIYRTSNSSTCSIPLLLGTTTLTHFTDLSSLDRGITYSYTIQIKDYCSGCTSNESNCASVTIPQCPTMSTPSLSYAVNGSTVTLTWNQITNATSYELYRSNGGTYIRIALLDSSTLTYTDYNLAPLTYYYKVRAVSNCDCTSPYSAEQTVVITGGSSSTSPALYYHSDHLGTIRLITDGSGTVVSRHDYEPFGTEIPPLSYSDNTHRFTGHERDSATGNDYMINRFYSAGMGRFTRTDPLSGDPTSPQSFNLYSYVGNNPIGNMDPLGLQGFEGNYAGDHLGYNWTGGTSGGEIATGVIYLGATSEWVVTGLIGSTSTTTSENEGVPSASTSTDGVSTDSSTTVTCSEPSTMSLSESGKDFIVNREGNEEKIYYDSNCNPTAGVGHLLTENEKNSYYMNQYVPQWIRDDWFSKDISFAEKAVQNKVGVPLTQGQYDALVSFTFNVGAGAFGRSQLRKDINAGVTNPPTIKQDFKSWSKGGKGLPARREKEANLYNFGIYK